MDTCELVCSGLPQRRSMLISRLIRGAQLTPNQSLQPTALRAAAELQRCAAHV